MSKEIITTKRIGLITCELKSKIKLDLEPMKRNYAYEAMMCICAFGIIVGLLFK